MSRGPRFTYQLKMKSCTCRFCNAPFEAVSSRARTCTAAECQAKAKAEMYRRKYDRKKIIGSQA